MKDYKKALLRLRVKLNISQEELASLLNVAFATVNRWENGRRIPSNMHLQHIEDLCKENNIDIE